MRLIMLGAPGSGKGTQAEAIVARYQITSMSTGDLLRAEVAAGTEIGKKAKAIMDAGELVPDAIVLQLIEDRLTKGDTANGFLLDGFPRNLKQAEDLDALLQRLKQPLDVVLFLEVDYDEIKQRLLQRRRADDTEEVISNRLAVYEAQTRPLVNYFENKGILRRVQGIGEIQEIAKKIFNVLDEYA